jgi:hypothetical protein
MAEDHRHQRRGGVVVLAGADNDEFDVPPAPAGIVKRAGQRGRAAAAVPNAA